MLSIMSLNNYSNSMASEHASYFFVGHDLRNLAPLISGADPYVGQLPNNSWPEHFTVTPPVFEIPGFRPERIFKEMTRVAETLNAFDITPIGDTSFDGETMTTLVDGLDALHYLMLGLLDNNGYRDQFVSRDFVGPDYNAHTSHLEGVLPPRKTVHVDSVSVFRKVGGKKFVDRRIMLKGRK